MMRKEVLIGLITFCLTATLFSIIPVGSQGVREYDPWYDINDDGRIDLKDYYRVGLKYDTTGTPINKTALLLELQTRLDSLNASLLNLEAYFETRITTLEATIADQQSRIADLETELIIINATKLGKPDYDSGWKSIVPGETIYMAHVLETTDLLVYVIGKDTDNLVHQLDYGWTYISGTSTTKWGLAWQSLNGNVMAVSRALNDENWVQVRVIIWKIPQP